MAVDRFEYKVIVKSCRVPLETKDSSVPMSEDEINQLGEEGWELSGVAKMEKYGEFNVYYFKRKKYESK